MPTQSPPAAPITWRSALLAVLCSVTAVQIVAADERAVPRQSGPQPFRIATLDVQRLVQEHPLHRGLLDLLAEQEEFQDQQRKRRQRRADELLLRLEKAEPGTRERKRIAAEIEQLEVDAQLSSAPTAQQLDGTEIVRRILGDIHEATARYCRQHGISLVLRRSASETDDEESPEVFEVVQRFVLYDAGHDITDDILRELQEQPAP